MDRKKRVIARNSGELAKALELNTKVAEEVQRRKLTHTDVARMAKTSRTRVTAILNRNTRDISTDLLLRVLYALGWTARVRFKRAA